MKTFINISPKASSVKVHIQDFMYCSIFMSMGEDLGNLSPKIECLPHNILVKHLTPTCTHVSNYDPHTCTANKSGKCEYKNYPPSKIVGK